MADITGPISTLAGHRHDLPEGTMCDSHPDRPAVARVQGETDSMGSELNDLCQECINEERTGREEMRTGQCEWCRNPATDLRDRRDTDEGMCGRVYRVCGACVKKDNERLEAELREMEDDY